MVNTTTTKTIGRLIFDLERGEDKTTRTIEIPFPKTDITSEGAAEALQTAIDNLNTAFRAHPQNLFVQPANWRDSNSSEEQWTTTYVTYEILATASTPITPDN